MPACRPRASCMDADSALRASTASALGTRGCTCESCEVVGSHAPAAADTAAESPLQPRAHKPFSEPTST